MQSAGVHVAVTGPSRWSMCRHRLPPATRGGGCVASDTHLLRGLLQQLAGLGVVHVGRSLLGAGGSEALPAPSNSLGDARGPYAGILQQCSLRGQGRGCTMTATVQPRMAQGCGLCVVRAFTLHRHFQVPTKSHQLAPTKTPPTHTADTAVTALCTHMSLPPSHPAHTRHR